MLQFIWLEVCCTVNELGGGPKEEGREGGWWCCVTEHDGRPGLLVHLLHDRQSRRRQASVKTMKLWKSTTIIA